jgi:hypothetical protein
LHYKQGICVVEEKLVNELFGFDDPMGQDIKIGGDYYRVVGISTEQIPSTASTGNEDEDATGAKKAGGVNMGGSTVPSPRSRTASVKLLCR